MLAVPLHVNAHERGSSSDKPFENKFLFSEAKKKKLIQSTGSRDVHFCQTSKLNRMSYADIKYSELSMKRACAKGKEDIIKR